MRRIVPLLAAALFAGFLTLFIPLKADAASLAIASPAAAAPLNDLLKPVYYYRPYHQKHDDYGDDDDSYGQGGYNDYGKNDYGHDDYGYGHHHHCGTHYDKKYVCDQTEPRCFRQRECVWEYGREYCRYVRKCVGGERYCKWVSYPVGDCGY